MPCIDGATGLSITFIIKGDGYLANFITNKKIRIFPSIQHLNNKHYSIVDPSVITYPVINITNDNDNYFTADKTEQFIQIDISNIYNKSLVSTCSSDRYFPLFLSFFEEENLTKIVKLSEVTNTEFDYIRIKEIIGKFVF